MGPWGSSVAPDSGYGNVHDDDEETLRFADEGEYAYDVDESEPATCLGPDMNCGRTLPCPDHPTL